MIDWRIKAREFANCNCDYSCPCQFNALPTNGTCEAITTLEIDEGHFGDVRLDGLRCGGVYKFPGPVHEGNGTMQLIIDERADQAQRDALITVMTGKETEPMATMWSVYTAMCSTVLDPVFKPIDFEVDIDARTARFAIPGEIEGGGEPIRNPVTGDKHRVRIDLPNGFEFSIAEIGSGTSRSTGAIPLELKDSYGQFAHIHLSGSGPVR